MYKLTETTSVIRISDGAFIPADEGNADWRDYQAWVDGGGTPAPAKTADDILTEQLAAIEAKYEATFGRLRSAMSVAMLADGPSKDAKITALRAEWAAASSAQSAEIASLIGG